MVQCCVLTLYFFPFLSSHCVACPRKKSHGNACVPCPSCPLSVLQYLWFTVLCLFLESWSFGLHLTTSTFKKLAHKPSLYSQRGLSAWSHTSFLCVSSWVDLLPIQPKDYEKRHKYSCSTSSWPTISKQQTESEGNLWFLYDSEMNSFIRLTTSENIRHV